MSSQCVFDYDQQEAQAKSCSSCDVSSYISPITDINQEGLHIKTEPLVHVKKELCDEILSPVKDEFPKVKEGLDLENMQDIHVELKHEHEETQAMLYEDHIKQENQQIVKEEWNCEYETKVPGSLLVQDLVKQENQQNSSVWIENETKVSSSLKVEDDAEIVSGIEKWNCSHSPIKNDVANSERSDILQSAQVAHISSSEKETVFENATDALQHVFKNEIFTGSMDAIVFSEDASGIVVKEETNFMDTEKTQNLD